MGKISERIKDIRKKRGLTQAQLAARCDVNRATVSKWENGKENPSAHAAAIIAGIGGITVTELLTGRPDKNAPAPMRVIRVVAPVQAGAWREAVEWDYDDQFDIPLPAHPSMPNVPPQGYRVTGTSMNRVYPDGTLVFVASTIANKIVPKSGQRVLVQRRDKHGLYEATIKEYFVDADGTKWLWPRSTDPNYQAPLRLDGEEDVTITGIVMFSFISEAGF